MTDEQNELMALVAKEAVSDWGTPDDRLRRYRVMTRAVIRSGDPDAIQAVRDYYGMSKK